MWEVQEAVAETLVRIQRYLGDNAATFAAVNQSDARKRLDDIVTQMGSHAVAQLGGHRRSQGETARQLELRLALRKRHMRPIAAIASQKLREVPEFTKLRLPGSKVRGLPLTAAAGDMANAAEKYADVFIKEGLAPDFVVQLRAATETLQQSVVTRDRNVGQRVGATKALEEATKRARGLIRQLDAVVRSQLETDKEQLRVWEVTSHIKRTRTSPSAAAATTVAPALPAPAAAPIPAATSTPPAA